MILDFSLRTVTPSGALDQFLPDFRSLDISPVFSSPGVLSISYPVNGVNFDLLQDDVEIAVLLNGVEVTSLRSYIESTDGNDASEAADGEVWTFSARTLMGKLDGAVVYPASWPTTTPPSQSYGSSTVGNLLIDLIGRAHTRGALSWLTVDFTSTHDSAGVAWSQLLDIQYDAGTKYSEVVDNLVKSSFVEVRMNGRILQAYNPGSLGSDKSAGTSPLRFTFGRDMKESPRKSTIRDLGTTVLVAGKDNAYVERVADSGSITTWGRRETSYAASNVDSTGLLSVMGDAFLETVKIPKLEVTHGLYFEDASNPKPVLDFDIGDWGLSDVGYGWERYRIKQWVVSVDDKGNVEGSVVLNSLIDEKINVINQTLTAMNNGTSVGGASEQVDDGKIPAVPGSISVSSAYYIEGNRPKAVVTVDWADVTTNSDGSSLSNLDGYTARFRYSTDPSDFWRQVKGSDTTTSIVYFDGVDTGRTIKVQVEAHNRYGRSSGWSTEQTHTTAADTVAPSKPSAPVVTSSVGTLRVAWDGLSSTGSAMDADLAGVEVHVGPNGTFTPDATTLKDYLVGSSKITTTLTGLTYGTEYFVRLVAVDTSGNRSAASDLTSTSHIVLSAVVNIEIGSGQVGLNNTSFSDVGNLVDDGNFENSQVRGVRSASMTGTHFTFDNTTSSVGTWSVRSDGYAGANEFVLLQMNMPVKAGERIFGAADFRSTTAVPVTAFVAVVIKWKNAAGNYIDNTGSVNNVYYQLANNWNTTVDNTWHSRATGSSQVAPTNAVTFEIYLANISMTAGSVWVDAVEIRRQVDTLLVSDAAITTAKIANLAVNDAKISDLQVGKLTTGTLAADIVLGARIKTANSGARVELNSAGLQAFNTSGVQTVDVASSTGNVSIIGQFASGGSGTNRVVIAPPGVGRPSLELYSTASSGNAATIALAVPMSASDPGLNLLSNNGGIDQGSLQITLGQIDLDAGASNYLLRLDSTAQISSLVSDAYLYLTSTDATFGMFGAARVTFDNSNNIRFTGKFRNYVAAAADDALFTGQLPISGFSGISLSYGTTMASTMCPIITLCDAGSLKSWQVTAMSNTGFTASFSSNVTGNLNFWVFRV